MQKLLWMIVAGIALTVLAGCSGHDASPPAVAVSGEAATARAIFAGGCFWCMEPPFEALPGVHEVISGYSGGTTEQPTYAQVSAGNGGHFEVVEVRYDPTVVSYEQLLEVFWRNIDPTDLSGQFCDRGPQYRSAIFYANEEQKAAAEASRRRLDEKMQVRTVILPARRFWPAEEYHQDYAAKNPVRYKFYRKTCGRDARLREIWGGRR